MEHYRGSPKHKNRPSQGRKGTLCPEWTHVAGVQSFNGEPHPWSVTVAQALFATSTHGVDGRRYATARGIAFEAKPTGDGTWHGFPVPWESVPPAILGHQHPLGTRHGRTMKDTFMHFGDPAQFQIAARWSPDIEARDCLPLLEGWSTGDFRITVCGQVLTAHRRHGKGNDNLEWYLSPVVDWLIRNWASLLHEERYAWPDKSGQPAAIAAFTALEQTIAATDEADRRTYAAVHAWWSRHALRAADSSAVYPDIYLRRYRDDIEVSWLSRQPEFAPDDFSLTIAPGYALLPVRAVAEPLWKFLDWATRTAPPVTVSDHQVIAGLVARFGALSATPLSQLEQAYVGERVQDLLVQARASLHLSNDGVAAADLPVIESLDSAVLMFGGLNVDLGKTDIEHLLKFLSDRRGQTEAEALSSLLHNAENDTWSLPYQEGYRLASECREELDIGPDQIRVDMAEVMATLNIPVEDHALDSPAIRGVAVAGKGYGPAVLVNTSSFYNQNEAGRRFTLAHELCHILYDRTRARKLPHLSGPWASARIEKRANAFAAMFLAPPSSIRHRLGNASLDSVRKLAMEVGMGMTALVEHLYNVDLITDAQREALRQG